MGAYPNLQSGLLSESELTGYCMPELPEIETLKNALEATVRGLILSEVRFFRDDLRDRIPVEKFITRLSGRSIVAFRRHGKYLSMMTDSDYCGIFHLGMSGQMLNLPDCLPTIKHTHAIFIFKSSRQKDPGKGGINIHYVDPRRFGRIDCIRAAELADYPPFKQQGPEPLLHSDLASWLAKRGSRCRQPIKSFLMDARVVAGVGNIYACEALFLASIHPRTRTGSLVQSDWERLADSLKQVLAAAIEAGGTTIKDFRQMSGQKGYFSLSLNVYGRGGEPCHHCARSISVSKISGRNSWFCENCQKSEE